MHICNMIYLSESESITTLRFLIGGTLVTEPCILEPSKYTVQLHKLNCGKLGVHKSEVEGPTLNLW